MRKIKTTQKDLPSLFPQIQNPVGYILILLCFSVVLFSGCQKDADGCGDNIWYIDTDGDGLGEPEVSQRTCEMPEGFVDNADDEIYIGAFKEGGIVFYVDETGNSGKVCTRMDIGFDGWENARIRCNNYSGGGFDNWYLPSREELAEMYKVLHLNEIGDFSEDYYWGSTVGINTDFAFGYDFSLGDSSGSSIVINFHLVRAVRSF